MATAGGTPIRPGRQKRSEWWVVGGVLVGLAVALAVATRDLWMAAADGPETVAKPQAASGPPGEREVPAKTSPPAEDLVDDDGKTLWASPTHGRPLDLAYLPPETEIILVLRPVSLVKHTEGTKILAALGPIGKQAVERLTHTTGLSLSEIERLVIGWRVVPNHGWAYSQLVYVRREVAQNSLRERLETHVPKSYSDRIFIFAGDRVYFHWGESDKLVEGTLDMFADFFPSDPLLPRDLERLLRYTDSRRQVTLVVRPPFLLGDQHELFRHTLRPLKPPLDEILGHEVAAAALSMNWDENFFIELVAVPTLDSSPEKMSAELAGRVNDLPDQVEEFVLGLQTSPYSRRVVARLPEMVRRLAAYTRHGFDRDAAVLRCYLPAAAGHNLLMAAELALAEWGGGEQGERLDEPPLAETSSPKNAQNIAERLQAKTTLRFDREELEAALDMLAQDLDVRIVIRGPDLQLDGITRNQLFAIDMADRSGEEILVEILRRANPDKLATGPADPRQKLVYVAGPDAIFITTRSRAAERGEALPAVFQPDR